MTHAKWSNEKAARLGLLVGQGKTASEIAVALDDGTSLEAVRTMCKRLGIKPVSARAEADVHVPLTQKFRRMLVKQSEALGIEPSEFVRRIMVCVLEDKMYQAVTDGDFD